MKTLLKMVAGLVLVVLLLAGAGFAWAKRKAATTLARTIDTHVVDFPIPFPLTEEEVAGIVDERTAETTAVQRRGRPIPDPHEGVDLDAMAMERAVARGEHLVHARYGCVECHGSNFGGGTMIDDPMIGRILGPNITGGAGGKTAAYTAKDWDRIVRHGVKPDGTPGAMPSEDFIRMSDRELSDIVAYIRASPAVENKVPPVGLGPLGTVLLATGKLRLAADMVPDHQAAHAVVPPPEEVSIDFGRHLAATCSGCHRPNFEGGPIPAGAPDWPPAANLSPHADGLEGWTYEQFVTALREGRRPDGTGLRVPMTLMQPYAANMSDVELQALWLYLESLEPVPDGR